MLQTIVSYHYLASLAHNPFRQVPRSGTYFIYFLLLLLFLFLFLTII